MTFEMTQEEAEVLYDALWTRGDRLLWTEEPVRALLHKLNATMIAASTAALAKAREVYPPMFR